MAGISMYTHRAFAKGRLEQCSKIKEKARSEKGVREDKRIHLMHWSWANTWMKALKWYHDVGVSLAELAPVRLLNNKWLTLIISLPFICYVLKVSKSLFHIAMFSETVNKQVLSSSCNNTNWKEPDRFAVFSLKTARKNKNPTTPNHRHLLYVLNYSGNR